MADANDKTGALVLVRRSQLIELQAEVSDDASLAHERIRSILAAPPAASVDAMTLGQRAVATELLQCCESWEPGVRVMGNVKAGDAADLLRWLIDSAGGAKVNEPFGNSEQLRQAAAGFLAASFYPDGDGYTDDMRQTYSYWHKRLLAELRPAGVMEYVQAEASARINARREAASD